MLYKVFPTEDELKTFQVDKLEKEVIHYTRTLMLDKFISTATNFNKNTQKLQESIVKKKIQLSKYLYQFIKVCCQNNEENQNYFLQFLGFYANHIGYGSFIVPTLEVCLGSNEKILKNLSSYTTNFLNNFEEKDSKKPKSLITSILYKFRRFSMYEKADLLRLLTKFCLVDDENSIYKNQEIIFQTINSDEELYYKIFMKIYSSDSLLDRKIYVELGGDCNKKGNSFSIDDILNHQNEVITEKEKEYLKQQLILTSNLCTGRNFTCIEFFNKNLPLKLLIKYALSENFPDDFRSCFCQLIRSIYLDKEPRTTLMKPNLVRKLELRPVSRRNDRLQSFRNPFSVFNKKSRSPSPPKKKNSETPDKIVSPNSNENENNKLLNEISPAFG